MAGISPKKLTDSLARAQKLINSETFNAQVELAGKRNAQNNGNVYESFDSNAISYAENQHVNKLQSNFSKIPQQNFSESKLPKEIIMDIMNNPIESDDAVSILDNISPNFQQNRPQLKENSSNTLETNLAAKTNILSQSQIDYSLIKAIIDESVKRNLSEMKNSLINENVENNIKLMRINNGNKIQILDTKGNLYEGVLKFKKNISK